MQGTCTVPNDEKYVGNQDSSIYLEQMTSSKWRSVSIVSMYSGGMRLT